LAVQIQRGGDAKQTSSTDARHLNANVYIALFLFDNVIYVFLLL